MQTKSFIFLDFQCEMLGADLFAGIIYNCPFKFQRQYYIFFKT